MRYNYRVQGVDPDVTVKITAAGGSFAPNTAEKPISLGASLDCGHVFNYEIYPGETVTFSGSLTYGADGTQNVLKSKDVVLSPADLGKAAGTLNCTYNVDTGAMTYDISVTGIHNPANPGSSIQLQDLTFVFTDGTGKETLVAAPGTGGSLPGGETSFTRTGTLNLKSLATGTYTVSAKTSGNWVLNGSAAQNPTPVVIPGNEITVDNTTYQVSPAAGFTKNGLTVAFAGLGAVDSNGGVTYSGPNDSLQNVRAGDKVAVKFTVTGSPVNVCEVGDLTLTGSGVGGFTRMSPANLPIKVTDAADITYEYQFTMPKQNVTDLAIQDLVMAEYNLTINLDTVTLWDGMTGQESYSAYFDTAPAITGDVVVDANGDYLAKQGGTITVSAGLMIQVDNGDGGLAMDVMLINNDALTNQQETLATHAVQNFATNIPPTETSSGSVIPTLENVSFSLTVNKNLDLFLQEKVTVVTN